MPTDDLCFMRIQSLPLMKCQREPPFYCFSRLEISGVVGYGDLMGRLGVGIPSHLQRKATAGPPSAGY